MKYTSDFSFRDTIKAAIKAGYRTIKVIIDSGHQAAVLVKEFGIWYHFRFVPSSQVIKSLRQATGHSFNLCKLIDRAKLPSGSLDNAVGSTTLRYKPAISGTEHSSQPGRLGTLTLSGLRLISSRVRMSA